MPLNQLQALSSLSSRACRLLHGYYHTLKPIQTGTGRKQRKKEELLMGGVQSCKILCEQSWNTCWFTHNPVIVFISSCLLVHHEQELLKQTELLLMRTVWQNGNRYMIKITQCSLYLNAWYTSSYWFPNRPTCTGCWCWNVSTYDFNKNIFKFHPELIKCSRRKTQTL